MGADGVLPSEVIAAIDRLARQQADSKKRAGVTLAKLAVLSDIGRDLRAAEREVVDELRATQPPTPWSEIADALGISEGAAWQRYASTEESTPEARKTNVRRRRPLAAATGDGTTLAKAAQLVGVPRGVLYALMEKHPGEAWHARIETTGKRGSVIRILDVSEARRVFVSDGITTKQAAQLLGADRDEVSATVERNLESDWLRVDRLEGGQRIVRRITDIDALARALESNARSGA